MYSYRLLLWNLYIYNSNFNEISNNNETGIVISNCWSLWACYPDGKNSDNAIERNKERNKIFK
ncbi:MAG: hypothetical protein ACK4YO_03665 [Candidatus Altarchaeaceae archaeon]